MYAQRDFPVHSRLGYNFRFVEKARRIHRRVTDEDLSFVSRAKNSGNRRRPGSREKEKERERRKAKRRRTDANGQCRLVYQSGIVGASLPFSTHPLLVTSKTARESGTTQSFLSFTATDSFLRLPSLARAPRRVIRTGRAGEGESGRGGRSVAPRRVPVRGLHGYLFKKRLYSKKWLPAIWKTDRPSGIKERKVRVIAVRVSAERRIFRLCEGPASYASTRRSARVKLFY